MRLSHPRRCRRYAALLAVTALSTHLSAQPVLEADILSGARPGDRIRLDLFDDASFVVALETVRQGRTWSGRIEGEPDGRFAMVRKGEVLVGLVRVPGAGTYRIRSIGGDRFSVTEIDEAALPPCANGPQQVVAPPAGRAAAGGQCADGSEIDLIVGYTPLARNAAGGTDAIEAEIELAVQLSNDAYVNSLIDTQLNVLHVTEVNYDESGSYQSHLYALTGSNDGNMDELHGLRYQFQADMVALIVADLSFCGIAWLLPVNSTEFDETAFSVTTWSCAAAGLTLAHELGHNQGCCHACGDGGGCGCGGLFSYSVGHRYFGDSDTQWRTVMAYPPGARIPNFSNPDVVVDGQPTGVPIGQNNEAHNAATINQTRVTIASFRCGLPYCHAEEILASDGVLSDGFAYAVANDGPLVVAGALMDSENGPNAGSAYVHRYDGAQSAWIEVAKLLPADVEALDLFGFDVAIKGSVVIVGAPNDDDNGQGAGAAYVFRFDVDAAAWVPEQKLTAADGTAGDAFGSSVFVDGSVAVVGAWLDDANGFQAGSAYVFRYDPGAQIWTQEQKLLPADGAPLHRFGQAVVVDQNVVLVGAPADLAGGEPGSVYAYRFDGPTSSWSLDTQLLAADGSSGDGFGSGLALSGDLLVVGAPLDNDVAFNAGSAYVLRHDGSAWQQEAELFAADGAAGDRFGTAVAASGNLVVVGADGDNDNGPEGGAAYVFHNDGLGWQEDAKLLAPGGATLDFFGNGVATNGRSALVGAFGDDAGGALFAYAGFSGADCNANGADDACDIATGASPDLNANGVPDGCETLGDTNGDGTVDVDDLLFFLGQFGPCAECSACPADFNGDCAVTVTDLLILLANWG